MSGFTMQEYIQANGLRASPMDPRASKLINEHLRAQGYVRVRRGGRWVYMLKAEVPDYDGLKQALGKAKVPK